MTRITGAKIIRRSGRSLNNHFEGSVRYPPGKWVTVGGNGAYIAVTGGLWSAGLVPKGALYVEMECDDPTGLGDPPGGVVCYRRARRLGPLPAGLLAHFARANPRDALLFAARSLSPAVLAECARAEPIEALHYVTALLPTELLEELRGVGDLKTLHNARGENE